MPYVVPLSVGTLVILWGNRHGLLNHHLVFLALFHDIQDEVTRAFKIFQVHGPVRNFPWHELFQPCTGEFFRRNPRFVQVGRTLLLNSALLCVPHW